MRSRFHSRARALLITVTMLAVAMIVPATAGSAKAPVSAATFVQWPTTSCTAQHSYVWSGFSGRVRATLQVNEYANSDGTGFIDSTFITFPDFLRGREGSVGRNWTMQSDGATHYYRFQSVLLRRDGSPVDGSDAVLSTIFARDCVFPPE